MRLILIREPIITLLVVAVAAAVVTDADNSQPPVCLSFSTAVSVCLAAPKPVALSLSLHCLSLTPSVWIPVCQPTTCIPVCMVVSLAVVLAKVFFLCRCLLRAFRLSCNKRCNEEVALCPSDTGTRTFRQRGQRARAAGRSSSEAVTLM